MATAVCPKCNTVSPLPDSLLGRTVRCRVCGGKFVAQAMQNVVSSAGGVANAAESNAFSIASINVPPPGGSTAPANAVKTGNTQPSGIVTVTARRIGTNAPDDTPEASTTGFALRAVGLLAAALALLLPISCAGAFAIYYNWGSKPASRSSTVAKARGAYYGGIEIGSGGIRGTVIDLFSSDNGEDYYTPFKESHDTKVVTGMEKTGEFDKEALAETIKIIQKYYKTMTKDYQIPPERIRIVGGSGLFNALKQFKTDDEGVRANLRRKNKAVLTDKVAQVTGKEVEFIEFDKEVELMIAGLVKERDANRAIIIDIGGSGTRGGYREQGGTVVSFKGPGLKEFESKVKASSKLRGAKPADFPAVAATLAEKELHEPFRKELDGDRKAGLNNREVVYLNGGIVWVMAVYIHPTERHTLVKLTAEDIKAFKALLYNNREKAFPVLSLPDNMDPKVRDEVLAEVEDMKTKFKMSRLLAGAEVLKALADEFKFQDKQLYFNRYGDVGWLLADIVHRKESQK